MSSIEEAARAHRWQDCSIALVTTLAGLVRSDALQLCRVIVSVLAHHLHIPISAHEPLTSGFAVSGRPFLNKKIRPPSTLGTGDIHHALELLDQSDTFDADSPDQLIAAAAAVGRAVFACRIAAWRTDGTRAESFASSPAAAAVGEEVWLGVAAALGKVATPRTDGSLEAPDASAIHARAKWAVEAGIL